MMKQFKQFARVIALAVAILVMPAGIFAQSSTADKIFNEGLKLQQTQTVAAQNQAIAKFTTAKKMYDSQAKKAQCDQAIQLSRNTINLLNKPKTNPNPNPNPTQNTTPAPNVNAENPAADRAYEEGLRLQKTMEIESQEEAIEKFKEARDLYREWKKRELCDDAISVSESIIGALQKKKPAPSAQKKEIQDITAYVEFLNTYLDGTGSEYKEVGSFNYNGTHYSIVSRFWLQGIDSTIGFFNDNNSTIVITCYAPMSTGTYMENYNAAMSKAGLIEKELRKAGLRTQNVTKCVFQSDDPKELSRVYLESNAAIE